MRAKAYIYTLFLLALFSVVGGVLRFALALAGKDIFFYAPKVLVVVALGAEVFGVVRSGRLSRLTAGLAVMLVVSGVVGIVTLRNAAQVGFGIYLLLPLVFAVFAQAAVVQNPKLCGRLIGLLWFTAAAGVVYGWMAPAPWVGFSYEIGDVTRQASREWTTHGTTRIAGFSQASFAAAYQLLFLAIPIAILWKRRFLALVVWIITGALITITTTKTALGVHLAFTVLLPTLRWPAVPRKLKRDIVIVLPWLVAAVAVGLPLSTLFVTYNFHLSNGIQAALFESFGDRLDQTWPDAFSLIAQHGNYIFGRGAGGIGTAQAIYEPNLYNPTDNIFVFGYCTFGILFLFALVAFIHRITTVGARRSASALVAWALAVAALTAGWTVGILEGGFGTLALGMAAGYAFRVGRRGGVASDAWAPSPARPSV